ncbi:hypothetical protein [Amycolatopsis ultiminotia]|uniref:hypothetical protein n=1 Tax=Amycolatopsis ultiminotia TaxID=543629 RepID=UPI0031ED637E
MLFDARFVVLANGFLEETVVLGTAGADSFEGEMFHSSRWPAGYTGAGDRIAVIGTGSSSIQIVSELARAAEHVTVFQRTPTWVRPKNNRRYDESERALMRTSAQWRAAHRRTIVEEREGLWKRAFLEGDTEDFEAIARAHFERQVSDRELRWHLWRRDGRTRCCRRRGRCWPSARVLRCTGSSRCRTCAPRWWPGRLR